MQLVHRNCLELQAVSLALKNFLPFLTGQHVHQNGQHHGSGIHKQTTGAVLRSSAHVGTQTDRVEQLSPIITESNACAGHSQPGSRFAVQGKSSLQGLEKCLCVLLYTFPPLELITPTLAWV